MADTAAQCEVSFRVSPRAALAALETAGYVAVDARSDALTYHGQRIMAWREPPINKGFG